MGMYYNIVLFHIGADAGIGKNACHFPRPILILWSPHSKSGFLSYI